MNRKLATVATFCKGNQFTEPQVRWWIHQAEANGLARTGAIVRIGRRVFIDTDKFWAWVDSGAAAKVAA